MYIGVGRSYRGHKKFITCLGITDKGLRKNLSLKDIIEFNEEYPTNERTSLFNIRESKLAIEGWLIDKMLAGNKDTGFELVSLQDVFGSYPVFISDLISKEWDWSLVHLLRDEEVTTAAEFRKILNIQ